MRWSQAAKGSARGTYSQANCRARIVADSAEPIAAVGLDRVDPPACRASSEAHSAAKCGSTRSQYHDDALLHRTPLPETTAAIVARVLVNGQSR